MDNITRRLAAFAHTLDYDAIPLELREAARQRLVDAIACAVGARDCGPARIVLRQAEDAVPRLRPARVLTYPERTTAESATFANGIMIRYLDFNDTGGGGGGHPSDCLGAILGLAEAVGADGRRVVSALVVAYEIIVRLSLSTHLRHKGWDQGFALGVATAAAVGHLMRLSESQLCHAIAIATVSNVPLRNTRAGLLSTWKGAAAPFHARNGASAALLAADGMTGPDQPYEGRHGLWEQITGPFEVEAFPTEGGEYLFKKWTRFKYWPAEYNSQIGIWAALALRQRASIDALESILIETYHTTWHEIGSEPEKWDPKTRETADHSLPYIFARALIDGEINVATFDADKYLDPGIRPLLNCIAIRESEAINAIYPAHIGVRVEATTTDGATHIIEMQDPRGHELNPMTLEDTGAKFRRTVAPVLGDVRADMALQQLWALDSSPEALTAALDSLVP